MAHCSRDFTLHLECLHLCQLEHVTTIYIFVDQEPTEGTSWYKGGYKIQKYTPSN